MLENVDFSLIDWSRAQFALTAMYHWLFVPLTLGITFIIAFMESIYVKTGNEVWKKMTKFWMTLFGVNFAIGVATGIILEFEFGTNWSNYSWFVGDIFGAPLAIEGILAFFIESTFIAVMFFGWNKVSPRFHLMSTWLTAIGANLSALWILVANGWMQNPVGMKFNIVTARNEMDAESFWDILLSPTAASKFVHTTTSSFMLAAIFVIGISAWFLLRNRHHEIARKSIAVASVFGLVSSIFMLMSGDFSAKEVARTQPMKLAAMEGLYEGQHRAPLITLGLMSHGVEDGNLDQEGKFLFKLDVPFEGSLSFLSFGDTHAFVPGIKDLVEGNIGCAEGIKDCDEEVKMSYYERIERGHVAQQKLALFHEYRTEHGDNAPQTKELFNELNSDEFQNEYFAHFGYGTYYDEDPAQLKQNALKLIPNVPLTFYAFHYMVASGLFFILLFVLFIFFSLKNKLEGKRWLMWAGVIAIPMVWLASQAGWIVAEVGRQPWVIQDMMSTITAVTQIETASVITTFSLFALCFTALLIAEIKIMITQIKKGPEDQTLVK